MKTQNSGLVPIPDSLLAAHSFAWPWFVLTDASTLKDYKDNRENGEEQDNPKRPFPSCGLETIEPSKFYDEFDWEQDKQRGYPDKGNKDRYWLIVKHKKSGTFITGFSQEPDKTRYPDKQENYWYHAKFTDTECEPIQKWMEEKDLNYLRRIKEENPTHYQQEMAELIAANPAHPAIRALAREQELMTLSPNALSLLPYVSSSHDLPSNGLTLGHVGIFGQSSQPNVQEEQDSVESTDSVSCCSRCTCQII